MTRCVCKRIAVTLGVSIMGALLLVGCSTETWSQSIWSQDATCFGRSFADPEVQEEAESYCTAQTKEIDQQALASRARIASVSGKYNEAFLLFLGACDESLPENCYRAAELWDQGIIDYAPPALAAYLYQVACENGHKHACEHPSQKSAPYQ